MTGFHLAQVNIGRTLAPVDGPELADFVAQLPEINALADRSPGFVWRLVDEGGEDSTGFRPDENDDMILINCSLWESVEALRNFTYHSDHLRVLSRRREWFHRMVEAHQALWWVPVGHRPSVAEAMERIALVREHGPGPEAFTFRTTFPAPVGAAAQGVPHTPESRGARTSGQHGPAPAARARTAGAPQAPRQAPGVSSAQLRSGQVRSGQSR